MPGTVTSVWFGQATAELELSAVQNRTRLGVDKQFGHVARAQPVRVGLDDLDHIRRFAVDRDFARPGQRRAPALARLEIRQPIGLHGVRDIADAATRQHPLDEDVLLQHHPFAGLRAESAKDPRRGGRPFFPGDRSHDRLHVDQSLDPLGMAPRPVKAERGAPVVDHEREVVAEVHALDPGVEPGRVVDEPVRARWRGARLPHADQVRRQATRDLGAVRDDVPPQVRGRRVSVQEDDRIARALVDVGHRRLADGQALARKRVVRRDVGHGCVNLLLATQRVEQRLAVQREAIVATSCRRHLSLLVVSPIVVYLVEVVRLGRLTVPYKFP